MLLQPPPGPMAADVPVEPFGPERLRAAIDIAFQPIVNVHTGTTYGIEALARGEGMLGFASVHDLLDAAFDAGALHHVDLVLRDLAVAKFARHAFPEPVRLFLNLDNRVLASPDYHAGQTASLLQNHGLAPHAVCLELSERHEIDPDDVAAALATYRRQAFRIAIDDFGSGFSGLKLLYEQHPDFIKVDRYFIAGIADDAKKKLLVSNVVSMAHVLGISVIAEGVETEREFLTCKEIGCDLAQGFLIQAPVVDMERLAGGTAAVVALAKRDRRHPETDADLIHAQIERVPALLVTAPMEQLFEVFRRDKQATFVPIVDERGEALGLVREASVKELAYSPFGKELLRNKAFRRALRDFVTPVPTADIRTGAEKVLEIFTLNENPDGVIITDDHRYVGILSGRSLLRVMNEKNLAIARDQNPLTKLPGNSVIADYSKGAIADTASARTFVYFDFNSFKPFNDHYGYRQGDRAIALFADLLRKALTAGGHFLGHVGGDDFFVSLEDLSPEEAEERVDEIRTKFASQVESFYDAEARAAGGIRGRDRDGRKRLFPLMTVSAAVLHLAAGRPDCTLDALTRMLAEMKKQAKQDDGGVAVATLACTCA